MLKNKWKIAFWTSSLLLVVVLGTGLYFILDQSVTIMYMQAGYQGTEEDLKILTELINETDLSKIEIEKSLKSHKQNESFQFGEDTIGLKRILLIFKDGKLAHIENDW